MTDADSGASIRLAQDTDGPLLQNFTCAHSPDEPGFEVQEQIQQHVLLWSTAHSTEDRRLFLLTDDATGNLIGVGAHKRAQFYEDLPDRPGRSIYLIAVSTGRQGGGFGGRRYCDFLLDALIDDILLRDGDVPITAIIHSKNRRSQALFWRHQFTNHAPWSEGCILVW